MSTTIVPVAVQRAFHRTRSCRRGIAVLALLAAASTTSCVFNFSTPMPTVTSLTVRNRSFFDVNVYATPSPGGMPVRLGTVTGSSSATFPIRALDLQSGDVLVVQVHPVGTRGTWTSDAVAISPGLSAVLDVSTDASGDCSRSSFYTIASTLLVRLSK